MEAGGMRRPSNAIAAAVAAHTDLVRAARQLSEAEVRGLSRLPGWNRARVLAHLAHKSRSHVSVFEGARLGEVREQYPSGIAVAESETEAWSLRPVKELCELLAGGFSSLERSWGSLREDDWSRAGISSAGERSMSEFVDRHMRDVFVHHVDLDIGYLPADWPAVFVGAELSKRLRDLPGRAEPHALLAWLFGRSEAPKLGPW